MRRILLEGCVKSLSLPSAAKHSLDRGCVKRFFLALRAKLNFDGDIFFLILQSKIRKKMSPSKEYFAAVGGENLFTQLLSQYNLARSANKRLLIQSQKKFFPEAVAC